jgi:hypothetical protein
MAKVVFRKKDAFLWIGGLLGSIGSVLLKIFHPLYVGGPVFIVGVALLLYGGMEFAPKATKLIDSWDSQILYKAFKNAAPGATIQIIQTSIPDFTALIGVLEDLLIRHDKHFRFRILLLDYEKASALLVARMRYRVEQAADHVAEIRTQVEQLVRFKERVDAAWKEPKSGAKLNLEVRLYSFLPFGSVFMIGDEKIYSGIFWNWTSSINGPMIEVADNKSKTWSCFEQHLQFGWKDARQVCPLEKTELIQTNLVAAEESESKNTVH